MGYGIVTISCVSSAETLFIIKLAKYVYVTNPYIQNPNHM